MRTLGSNLFAEARDAARCRRCRRPSDDPDVAADLLDEGRAALDPVAAIEIAQASDVAVGGVVDVAADDAVGAAPARLLRERVLEFADIGDRRLDPGF